MSEPGFTPDQMKALDHLLTAADKAGPWIRGMIASAYVTGLKAGDEPARALMNRMSAFMIELQRLRLALETIADEGDVTSAARARAALNAAMPPPGGPP